MRMLADFLGALIVVFGPLAVLSAATLVLDASVPMP